MEDSSCTMEEVVFFGRTFRRLLRFLSFLDFWDRHSQIIKYLCWMECGDDRKKFRFSWPMFWSCICMYAYKSSFCIRFRCDDRPIARWLDAQSVWKLSKTWQWPGWWSEKGVVYVCHVRNTVNNSKNVNFGRYLFSYLTNHVDLWRTFDIHMIPYACTLCFFRKTCKVMEFLGFIHSKKGRIFTFYIFWWKR